MKIKSIILAGTALLLVACGHNIQTTSGAEYLKGYSSSPAYSALDKTNTDIYNIAAIEPNLKFPARIGIARIGPKQNRYAGKQLTSLPGDEAQIWSDLVEREGGRYGEFVPVSPFVTAMVSASDQNGNEVANLISNIRKGAARQHLDYVLVYEVTHKDARRKNGLGFTDATVLGLFLIPSRKVEVDTIATAILLDVRNGYPYMTASSFAEHKSTTTLSGSDSKSAKLADKGRLDSIRNLSIDVENGFRDLKDEAYANLVAQGF